MKLSNYFSGLLLLLITSVTACGDDNEISESESQLGVAINSITASTAIDLSARNGWLFRVGYSNPSCLYYNYNIDGNKLYAFAEPLDVYRFDARLKEGDLLGIYHRIVCYLQDKRYFHSTNNRSMSPERPDILDQSTEERLLIADRLEATYRGEVRNNISGINFIHANSLVEFEITGINASWEVFVYSWSFPITPFKTGDYSYKAIVPESPSICIKNGNKQIGEIEITNKFKSNTYYTVKLHWDSDSKKIILDNVKEKEWK